ncbi:MAG TPA: CoA-acylating methylmalonate-semialdehyde dehydrogenase [Anaerolineales bacterium]|nr:CoA-acylating methylmalonate-semialdehyde dehydrogenase [Anaerolineales bacterium]
MKTVLNYINGQWREENAAEYLDVINPASQERLARTPLCAASVVDQAARAAATAYPAWRNTPPADRIQPLFKLKMLMETHLDELARTITLENGKIYSESVGEMRRAIENVEVACGIPTLMMGDILEDVASGIDEFMIRQPVGVVATIAPFNFPGMIPFWYLPYALACGNTYIVKPSERVPLTMQKVFELIEQCGFPPGVVNMVQGGADVVNAILDHPTIRGVTFVGSTAIAKHVYSRASANGKRVQAQGGAKNPTIILPDAEVEMTTKIIADSAFGCAGQRCLATSLVFTVGKAEEIFTPALAEAALTRVTGFGLDDGVQMGPVITHASRARIEGLIAKGIAEGAEAVVDGRGRSVQGFEGGSFIHPTLLSGLNPQGEVIRTEIFGPVLGMVHLNTVEEAIELVNSGQYGNMACLFTSSGAAARKFRHDADAGNIGINIGVAAPMAYFPFSGWKDSFFGTLHGQGKQAVEFFTQTKVVVERWPKDWSRQF